MIFQYLANEAGIYPSTGSSKNDLPLIDTHDYGNTAPPPTRARCQLTRSAIRKEAEKLFSTVPKLDFGPEEPIQQHSNNSKTVTFITSDTHSSDDESHSVRSSGSSSRLTFMGDRPPLTGNRMSRKTLIDSLSSLNLKKRQLQQKTSSRYVTPFHGLEVVEPKRETYKSNQILISHETRNITATPKRSIIRPEGYVKCASIPTSERKQSDFIVKSKGIHHPTKQLHIRSQAISLYGYFGRGKFAGISCWKNGYGNEAFEHTVQTSTSRKVYQKH